jgi:hypothetical protein
MMSLSRVINVTPHLFRDGMPGNPGNLFTSRCTQRSGQRVASLGPATVLL